MSTRTTRTQVAIIGAGPSGLLLAQILHRAGIDSVVLEARSRDYILGRLRAAVLEQGTVDLLTEAGVADRLHERALVRHGVELRIHGRRRRIPVSELAGGRAFTIYGQERLVADLVDARLETGRPLLFEAEALGVDGALTERPVVRYRHEGAEHELACALVAGCDGFHGASRRAIPDGVLRTFVRDYGTGWLGVLVDGQPSTQEPIWCHSEHGFVLCTVRGAERSRMFLQCGPHDDPADWPQERIWRELGARLAAEDGWALQRGDILNVTPAIPFRSFVAEPMQYGRLYLAGDAAHIVPPLGAKGLNLAVGDIRVLSEAMTTYFESGETALLESYSRTCLERVWRVQRFSSWATRTFHRFPDDEPFQKRVQRAELEYLASSEAAARTFAESFVGLHRSPMAAGAQPGSAL